MPRKRIPLDERFWKWVSVGDGEDDCWIWMGYVRPDGYGAIFGTSYKNPLRVHRVCYEFLVGPIPDGLELDHLCRNPRCVRPDHLEPVTHRENLLRGNTLTAKHARTTACPWGHPYDENNTYVSPSGGRQCRTCNRINNLKSQKRCRAKRNAYKREWKKKRREQNERHKASDPENQRRTLC